MYVVRKSKGELSKDYRDILQEQVSFLHQAVFK